MSDQETVQLHRMARYTCTICGAVYEPATDGEIPCAHLAAAHLQRLQKAQEKALKASMAPVSGEKEMGDSDKQKSPYTEAFNEWLSRGGLEDPTIPAVAHNLAADADDGVDVTAAARKIVK